MPVKWGEVSESRVGDRGVAQTDEVDALERSELCERVVRDLRLPRIRRGAASETRAGAEGAARATSISPARRSGPPCTASPLCSFSVRSFRGRRRRRSSGWSSTARSTDWLRFHRLEGPKLSRAVWCAFPSNNFFRRRSPHSERRTSWASADTTRAIRSGGDAAGNSTSCVRQDVERVNVHKAGTRRSRTSRRRPPSSRS